MKSLLWKLLIYFLVGVTTFACKRKYEDGPLISLNSKCNRLTSGQWKLEYLYIENIDSTEAVYSSLGISNSRMYLDFIVNDKNKRACLRGDQAICRFNKSNGVSMEYSGNYDWSSDKRYLKLLIIDTKGYINQNFKPVGPFFTGEFLDYRIKRLTSENLWLGITYNNKKVDIHFRR